MGKIAIALKNVFSEIYQIISRNRVLLAVSNVMGIIMTHVVFTVGFIFFAIVGIIYRMVAKDPLDRKLEKNRHSYWVQKPERDFDPKRYLRQF